MSQHSNTSRTTPQGPGWADQRANDGGTLVGPSDAIAGRREHEKERQDFEQAQKDVLALQPDIADAAALARSFCKDPVVIVAQVCSVAHRTTLSFLRDPELAAGSSHTKVIALPRSRLLGVVRRRAPHLVEELSTRPRQGVIHVLHVDDRLTVHTVSASHERARSGKTDAILLGDLTAPGASPGKRRGKKI